MSGGLADVPAYFTHPGQFHSVSTTRVVFCPRGSAAAVDLDVADAQMLALCRVPRSMREHVSVVARSLGVHEPTAVGERLGSFVLSGLLRECPAPATVVDAVAAGAPQTPTRISTVAIVTADRPFLLERCLSRLSEAIRKSNAGRRVLVVDGSREAANCYANKEAVSKIRLAGSPFVDYVGKSELAPLRDRARSRGLPREVVESALTLGSIGANRNIALLLTAGEPMMMVDDDILLDGRRAGGGITQVALVGHGDHRAYRFFGTRAEAVSAAMAGAPVSVVEEHEQILGRSLVGALRHVDGAPDMRNACPHLLEAYLSGRGTVRLTFSGLVGDAGVSCQYALLFAPIPSARTALESRDTFDLAMHSREVERVAERVLICHDPSCMSYCIGIDNRSPVVPFIPVSQNEDGAFGAMLAYVHPSAVFAHLPHSVLHDSRRPSEYPLAEIQSASRTHLAEMFLANLRGCMESCTSTDPAMRLDRMCDTLRELATLPVGEFRGWFQHVVIDHRSRALAQAEQDLDRRPDYWRLAIGRYRQVFLTQIQRPDFFVPIEVQNDSTSSAQAFRSAQRMVMEYVQLVEAWRHVWEHCAGDNYVGSGG